MIIKHVQTSADEGPEPNAPSVASMRASQASGSTGIGTAAQSYNRSLHDFNQGLEINSQGEEGCDINHCCQPGEDDCPCCGT